MLLFPHIQQQKRKQEQLNHRKGSGGGQCPLHEGIDFRLSAVEACSVDGDGVVKEVQQGDKDILNHVRFLLSDSMVANPCINAAGLSWGTGTGFKPYMVISSPVSASMG